MKHRNTIALFFLFVMSCAKTVTTGPDSETNWLTCNKVADCPGDNAVACVERYCVDANGERISATDSDRMDATADVSQVDEVTALQIDGVWVFEYDPDGFDNALLSGPADIVDGCLVVDNAVVVWHVSQRSEAESVVSEVLSGKHPQMELGGGGLSLSEGSILDDFPAAVTERCAVSEVWFANRNTEMLPADDFADTQGALPNCAWPAELGEAGELSREVCSAGRVLLSCELGEINYGWCISDNAVSCPDDSIVPATASCTSVCEPDEYVAQCGDVGPGAVPDPPEGCSVTIADPSGVSEHCCPCL